jgi:heptosyltransferase-2
MMPGGPEEARHHVVRAPNHLGDVVMALPALRQARADILVLGWLAPILEMASLGVHVIPFERGWAGWRTAVRRLRRTGYGRGTLLTPSFSAAWLLRWGGVTRLRGTATDGRSWLLSERVPRESLRGLHRINQYHLLLDQALQEDPTLPTLTPPRAAVDSWREQLGVTEGPVVGLFPGSNASARRWPTDRFGAVGRSVAARGARVIVIGSGAERALTATVAAQVPGAMDAGGATDLPGLAAVLSMCDLLVTNDSGPMHVAGAVGTPTVTLWGPSDPAEVGPPGSLHVRVEGGALPCRPCFRNTCPRSGPGTRLPDAHEECMRLITIDRVIEATSRFLEGAGS